MALLLVTGGCQRCCCRDRLPIAAVPPINGMDRALGADHASVLFEMEIPAAEGSSQLHAQPPIPGSALIKVAILRTDMKDPCIRRESELSAPPQNSHRRPVAMVADQIIVRFKDSFSELEVPVFLTARKADLVRHLLAPKTYLVRVRGVPCANAGEEMVRALPRVLRDFESHANVVEYAEPNFLYFAEATPNDPMFDQLWALDNPGRVGSQDADIDALEGWDIIRQSPDVVVAVIDTGVDGSHDDLVANLWRNTSEDEGTPGYDDDDNGFEDDVRGWDFYNHDADPDDFHGHGTHVSGTIGAVGDNGIGVVGVSWTVKLMPLKFMQALSGETADASDAIRYATNKGVVIMSNSWGGGAYSETLLRDIDAAGQLGILFVAAAGNDKSTNNDVSPHYPSSYDLPNIIAVAATNQFDLFADFSSYGPESVDLAAPGVDILSTGRPNSYTVFTGTSMATAYVSGACALMKQSDSSAPYDVIKRLLMDSTDLNDSLSGLCVSGGRLNLQKALKSVQDRRAADQVQ